MSDFDDLLAPLDGWRALGCAVLLRAYKDAAHGNGESQAARQFLASDGARWLVAALDLDPAQLAPALGQRALVGTNQYTGGGAESAPPKTTADIAADDDDEPAAWDR